MRRRARPAAAAAVVALLAALYAWLLPLDSPDVYAGLPGIQSWGLKLSSHTLQNPGFAIGYSEWYRAPLWVAFRARALPPGKAGQRPERFGVDERTLARVSAEDYSGSGYDRGHLAPNFLIARLYGRDAQRATFDMSNIAPQTPRLNQLLWQRIEEAEADIVAPAAGELWVVAGPVFGARRLHSGVAVPEAFYRIWLDDRPRRVLAFLVPQDVCGDEPLERFVVTVDEVERHTGLDFFHRLPDAEEAALEAAPADPGWGLSRFGRAPARYAKSFRGSPCRPEVRAP
ncbi:MAG: DNA/RNA non-specific endonuclease [Gammaproteobacteria bacterium]|nr:DNA/RNA non-specific endonuclease [Gammaproteobacteria bacterium]